MLNILGGYDTPSAGRCVVAGNDLTRLNNWQRIKYRQFVVGHVWQQSGRNLLPELSASANIQLPQMLAGVKAKNRVRRTEALLELIGLEGKGRQRPDQLSGGEQQRVAIAVALANQPVLLLADEPTGELDSVTAGEILALLHRLNKQLGLTVVIVTHDVAIAANVDRTIANRDGRTSTETVRREAPIVAEAALDTGASAIIGLPGETHQESLLIDRVGRLQLPKDAVENIPYHGRAIARIFQDHVELWPVNGATINHTHQAAKEARVEPTRTGTTLEEGS